MISSLLKKTSKTILNGKFDIGGQTYTEDGLIGEGAYAYVYRVKDSTGKSFALKKIICQTEEQITETKKEIKLLSSIKHPGVLSLSNSSFHINSKKQTEAFLLLPLYGKSTQDIIDQGPGYPYCAFESRGDVLKILVQCIEAIAAIHSFGYTHCDVKPANVLLDGDMNAIVTDFGSASPLTTTISSRSEALSMQEHAADNTTASFRPPELFDTPSHCTIDGKVDVWSLGCTLYALMFSRTPFENPAEGGLSVLAVMSSRFSLPAVGTSRWPEEYHTLIKASLRPDFTSRLSIEELRILASMLPEPDSVDEVLSGVAGTPAFTATPGLTPGGVSSSDDLFAAIHKDSKSPTLESTGEGFAHFEDFGDFQSNTTSVVNDPVSPNDLPKDISPLTSKLTIDESKCTNNEEQNDSNCDDDSSDFGDFVQADIEHAKPVTSAPVRKNVSMSGVAYVLKSSKTGPFRSKSGTKKKVKIIVDNTWLCIKKNEGHPGKIYFDGCLTAKSTVEEVPESTLGNFVFRVRNVDMHEEKQSCLVLSAPVGAGDKGSSDEAAGVGMIDVGFDTSEDMKRWREALQEQVPPMF